MSSAVEIQKYFGTTEQHSTGMAFLLWLSCLLGVCGIHRFYLRKPLSGLLYLLTFGIFGIGQIIDLFIMRDMVQAANARSRGSFVAQPAGLLPAARSWGETKETKATKEDLRMKLVRTALAHGGKLSVSQGVMATGRSFEEIEALLDEMAKSGFVGIDNDPETGAVVYTFDEL